MMKVGVALRCAWLTLRGSWCFVLGAWLTANRVGFLAVAEIGFQQIQGSQQIGGS
jgi:hypothetical protein